MPTDKALQRTFLSSIQKQIEAMNLTDTLDLQIILIDGSRCPVNHVTHGYWNDDGFFHYEKKKQKRDQSLTEILKSFFT